ncbi:MAG TPA: tetratricopeptide repeat protein [Methylomirabilota bacterium]|jgi:tetratricopeptide (TPR) repeat protein|nr:tetratricopeptide repeat protein [Methylomirabilota bacterium]
MALTLRPGGALLPALLFVLGLALVTPAATPVTPPTSGPVAEAWALFRSFHEDLARIDRARELLERSVAREPTLDALLLLGWVHLTWADLRATSLDEKLAGYERGRDVAKRAVELDPRSPEAHLWYAANLGRWAIAKGKLRAAFLLGTLKEEIETVLRLDPNHVGGLALAGSFYLETPGLMGGDLARAEAYERKALGLDPHFTRARVELAKCLIERRRYAEARRELQQVLDERAPTYVADWVVRHRPTAERLLAQLRDKS